MHRGDLPDFDRDAPTNRAGRSTVVFLKYQVFNENPTFQAFQIQLAPNGISFISQCFCINNFPGPAMLGRNSCSCVVTEKPFIGIRTAPDIIMVCFLAIKNIYVVGHG